MSATRRRHVGRILAALLIMTAVLTTGIAAPAAADRSEGAQPAVRDQQRRVSVGGLHTCAILDDGGVQCWGDNTYGQLGDNTTTTTTRPRHVVGVSTAIALASASSHTCALLHGGAVQCWGLNGSGQLGDGTTTDRLAPTQVSGLDDATVIAAGGFHSCAIVTDGTVRCWGLNSSGQLGSASSGTSLVPAPVTGITTANPAVAITAGEFHTCAVLQDGMVACWGHNGLGQLGDGTTSTSLVPVTVSGITSANPARAIAAGYGHTCVVLDDGTLRCWGHNSYGQLGNDSTTDTTTPVTPNGNVEAVAIAAGVYHTCALRADGEARCWGNNGRGQLGYVDPPGSDPKDQRVPVEVQSFGGGTALTAGGFHTCALTGTVLRCWGYNFNGQLGSFRPESHEPVVVTALSGARTVTVGDGHACSTVGDTHQPVCWGDNTRAQLGAPVAPDTTVPVPVDGLPTVAALSAGNRYTCALVPASGTPRCWGANGDGQLGDGTTIDRPAPVPTSGLTTATQVAAGGGLGSTERGHTCARLADGTAQCWGRNLNGQLGDGTTTDRSTPVSVATLTGASAVATGGFHSCAVVAGGQVRCWGFNGSGQLGDDSNDQRIEPVAVSGLSGASSLALGDSHSCAIVGSTVRCWGANSSGQLGDNTTTNRDTPVTVSGIGAANAPVAITAGDHHTCVLLADSEVRCWGDNSDGQLGDATTTDRRVPTVVPKLDPPSGTQITTAVGAGRRNTCARLVDTTVRCWGDNSHGQLGDGVGPMSVVPLQVTQLGGTVATNAIPSPVDDAFSTAPLTAHTLDVLANDTDADGDTLTIAAVADPPRGSVTFVVTGNVTYTPDAAVCDPLSSTYGTDQFTYTATDGTASVPATVTVTVTCPNRPPQTTADSATTAEDTATTIDVLANDGDPDGDALTIATVGTPAAGTAVIATGGITYTPSADTCGPEGFSYSVDDGNGGTAAGWVSVTVTCVADGPVANDDIGATTEGQPVTVDVLANDTDADPATVLTVQSAGPPSHGTVTNDGAGQVTYTPQPGYCGPDSFPYRITDGALAATAQVLITVACINDGPNAADDSAITDEDASVLIDVLANDIDPDGDTLTIVPGSVTTPAHGSATIEGTQIRYSPAPDFCGADGFGYVVTDPDGQTDAAVVAPVAVICHQDPPTANDDTATTPEDTPVAVPVLANDTDPDNDLLAITVVTGPAHGTAVIAAGGTVTYTPESDYCGPDAFDTTIDDGHGATATATATITVTCVNDPPTIEVVPNQQTPWGDLLTVLTNATDVDGDPVGWSLLAPPAGATISPAGAITWTPSPSQVGAHTLTVRISDGAAYQDTTFRVDVVRRATTTAWAGATSGQYSDPALVAATLVDTATGAPIAGASIALAIGTHAVTRQADATGLAEGHVTVTTPPGTVTAAATYTGSGLYLPSTGPASFTIHKETIVTRLTKGFLSTTSGGTATVTLTATLTQQDDGTVGAGMNTTTVTFSPPGQPSLCTTTATSTAATSATATCSITSLPIGARAIVIRADGPNYTGPVDVAAIAIGTSTSGSASGGGRVAGTTTPEAFAFHHTPSARKTPATGSVVHVIPSLDGLTATIATSTSNGTATRSCTGGKTKQCSIDLTYTGATAEQILLSTGARSTLAGTSSVALRAVDVAEPTSTSPPSDRYAVQIFGALSHAVGSPTAPVTITDGNIRIS